jgi:hypothetical protein
MSQAGANNNSGGSGSGIQTIDGDTGSITGSTVTVYAHKSTQNSGSSVGFVNSGTTSTFNVTDASGNTIIGKSAGNSSISGTDNTGLGAAVFGVLTSGTYNTANGLIALQSLSSGSYNCAWGAKSLGNLLTGSYNLSLGYQSGILYTSSESDNITLNSNGSAGKSNELRIGAGTGTGTQQLSTAYISGITGNTSTSSAVVVGLDTSVDQLLQTTITAGSGISVTPSAGAITIANTATSGSLVLLSSQTASTSSSLAFTLNASYKSYQITFRDLTFGTGADYLILQVSSNGGSSYASTGYISGLNSWSYNSATGSNVTVVDGLLMAVQVIGGGIGASGSLFLGQSEETSFDEISGVSTSGNSMQMTAGIYYNAATPTDTNAFQIVTETRGTFSGTFTLYGFVE